MEAQITLMPALECDADALDAIQKRAFEPLYRQYHDENSPYCKGAAEITKWLRMPDVIYSKILRDGELCGGIAYYRRKPGHYYLARVFVDPQLQGKGIANTAIALCEQALADAVVYDLDFPVDQQKNRCCYERAGFVDTGERRIINELLTLAIYKKHVGNPVEYFDVLDEAGEKTGEIVERAYAHRHGIRHRVVHAWLINGSGELLIQRRSATKEWMPDKLYVSLGGHIVSDETPEDAIVREFAEELGLDVSPHLDKLQHVYRFEERSVMNEGTFIEDEIYEVYTLRLDVDAAALKLQDEEVADAFWMPYPMFRQMILDHAEDFVDHGDNYLPLIAHLDTHLAQ